jgi:hypothetical protein
MSDGFVPYVHFRPCRPRGVKRDPVGPVALAEDVQILLGKGHADMARALVDRLPAAIADAVDHARDEGYAAGLLAAEKARERMSVVPPDVAMALIRSPATRHWVQNTLDLTEREVVRYLTGSRQLSTYQRKKLAKALDTVDRVEKIKRKIPKAKRQPPKKRSPYKWKPSR